MNAAQIQQLYRNPRYGLNNADEFYRKVKKDGLTTLTKTEFLRLYRTLEGPQIFRPQTKGNLRTDLVPNIGYLQADLMDVSRFASQNKGVRYLFNVIDVYSRKAWSFPVRNKQPESLIPGMKAVIADFASEHERIVTLTTDKGSEFKGALAQLLKKEKIKQRMFDIKGPTSIIERFNRTLLRKISQYVIHVGAKWIDVLPQFVESYNTSIHTSLMNEPAEVFDNVRSMDAMLGKRLRLDERTVPSSIAVGDIVRTKTKRKTFDKQGVTPTYSRDTYEVIRIENNRYKLKNTSTGLELKKKYVLSELQKIPKESQVSRQRDLEAVASRNRERQRNIRSGLDVEEGRIQAPPRVVPIRPIRERAPSRRVIEHAQYNN